MATKDDNKTSLGIGRHGIFAQEHQEQLTIADVHRMTQQLNGLTQKAKQLMLMRGQKSIGQVLEGQDYNKDAISTIEQCSQAITAVVSKGEVLSPAADYQNKNESQSRDIAPEHNDTHSFKMR